MLLGLLLIPSQSDREFLSLGHQKGEVNLRHFQKPRQSMLVVSGWQYSLVIYRARQTKRLR